MWLHVGLLHQGQGLHMRLCRWRRVRLRNRLLHQGGWLRLRLCGWRCVWLHW